MEDIEQELKRNIFFRAEVFLNTNGNLCPFGAKVVNDSIQDVVIYDDSSDIFEGQVLIDRLKEGFNAELIKAKINAAAISYDVSLDLETDGTLKRKDALCILISTDGILWSEEFYLYSIIDDKVLWE